MEGRNTDTNSCFVAIKEIFSFGLYIKIHGRIFLPCIIGKTEDYNFTAYLPQQSGFSKRSVKTVPIPET